MTLHKMVTWWNWILPPLLLLISRRYGGWYLSKINCLDGKERSQIDSTIGKISTYPLISINGYVDIVNQ